MKALIFVNDKKDQGHACLNLLIKSLTQNKIEYKVASLDTESVDENYSVIFVIGGDGTILRRTEFANKNKIPIIGINTGKLGFLSEFEPNNIEEAVESFVNNKLVIDNRQTISLVIDNKEYLALNDVVIQRLYVENEGMIIDVNVSVDDVLVDNVRGDGVIIATPTGSTAYSLSAGGAILAPKISAFIITPIASHSFNQRPVVYSSCLTCECEYVSGNKAGVFVDGKFVKNLNKGDKVIIKKADNDTTFLRKNNSNFFKTLYEKIEQRGNK